MQCLWYRSGLDCSVAELGGPYCPPRFVASDPFVEDLGNGVEGQLARLRDEDVRDPHEVVRRVHRMEGVVEQEHVDALEGSLPRLVRKALRIVPRAMQGDVGNSRPQLRLQPFPVVCMVPEVDHECRLAGIDGGHHVLHDGLEEVALGPCTAHSEEVAPRLTVRHPGEPTMAVVLDVLDELVVHVVADVVQRITGHRVEDRVLLVEPPHRAEPVVAGRRLDRMLGPFDDLERHRPVVEHHVDRVGHSACHSTHGVPHV